MIGALSFLVALFAWAIASPLGSTPDEDYHLISIWCSHGIREGACEPGPNPVSGAVPERVVRATCYAFKSTQSASCQADTPVGNQMIPVDRGNFTGDYPPVFYYVEGLFVGRDVTNSVIIMRLFNAVLFVGLIATVYLLLPAGLRRPLIGAPLVTAVPLGMFLVPSINPSGWGLLSAATFLVSLLGFLTVRDRRRKIALGVLTALSLLIGAGARADIAIYTVVAIVVAIIFTARSGARNLRHLVFPALLAIAATLAFLSAGQSSAADLGVAAEHPSSFNGLVATALNVPSLWPGGLGLWGLGWLDTNMPAVIWVGMWGVFTAILFTAVAGAGRRRGLAVGTVALAALAVPTYIQFVAGLPVGAGVQPRYILPLLTMLAATAMVRLDGPAFRLTGGQRWIVVAVLSVANAVALHVNIRRYVTGSDVTSFNLNRNIEWWWSIPVSPLMLWAVGALAFGVGAALLTKEFTTVSAANADAEAPPSGRHAAGVSSRDLPAIGDLTSEEAQAGITQGGHRPVVPSGRTWLSQLAGNAGGFLRRD